MRFVSSLCTPSPLTTPCRVRMLSEVCSCLLPLLSLPVHAHAILPNVQIAGLLLDGCEPEYKAALVTCANKYGNTALDVALAHGPSPACAALLEAERRFLFLSRA